MYIINKITFNSVIDYAAEELKKYLRMMMPEGGDVKIVSGETSEECFRLGLMQDFGLDVSDAEVLELDDVIYISCTEKGGIIAGANPRAVLLAVYEYLRQNGCRWLFPGIDGEYIPMTDIHPVKYRHKPSCRYRGWCSEGAQFQPDVIDAIDFAPKVGLNAFMIQFINPALFYQRYYNHSYNDENRRPEPISNNQAIQWKRQCETEFAKRGIQFHDIGHGFNYYPFGIIPENYPENTDFNSVITSEQREYISEIGGVRSIDKKDPSFTNFCMSNPKARKKVVDYVADFALKHENVDYLHLWLADGTNNHCECSECQKKTPSDWYMILLNEIEEKLTEVKSDMRIVFISYVDTTWAPLEETLKKSDRFALMLAPIFRSYAYSVPENREKTEILPYKRNKNEFPRSLAASLDYFAEWKKTWHGSNIAFEYHFWRHQCHDLSGLMQARVINEDVKVYKESGIDGLIACGTQRPFFPNGFPFYTYARTMFDTSLTYEQLCEDYYKHLYGDNHIAIRKYLEKIYDIIPFEYFSVDAAWERKEGFYDPERAKILEDMRSVTEEGRRLIKESYKHDYRVRTVALRLLEFHADFCDLISDWMVAKARNETEKTWELFEKARIEIGKREQEFERYFDHHLYFLEYHHCEKVEFSEKNDVVAI